MFYSLVRIPLKFISTAIYMMSHCYWNRLMLLKSLFDI